MFDILQLTPVIALMAGGILVFKDAKTPLTKRKTLGCRASKALGICMCVISIAWLVAIIVNEPNWIDMP